MLGDGCYFLKKFQLIFNPDFPLKITFLDEQNFELKILWTLLKLHTDLIFKNSFEYTRILELQDECVNSEKAARDFKDSAQPCLVSVKIVLM